MQRRTLIQPKFNDVAFNNDGSCISIATNNGFKVYNTYPLQCKLIQTFESSTNRRKGLGLTRMLNRSNYIALCGGGKDPRYPLNKLIIWDDLYGKESIILSFMSMIRDVFLTRCHIVVLLDDKVCLYSFSKQPVKLIDDLDIPFGSQIDFRTLTSENTKYGSEASGIICFESPIRRGQVHIATLRNIPITVYEGSSNNNSNNNSDNDNDNINDTNTSTTETRHKLSLSTTIIKAHKSEIQLIRLNHQGTIVATCSKKGTIIRLFNVHNGALIREFRRGIDNAEIYAMEFSPRGSKLAVVSTKQTLHIFEVSSSSSSSSGSHVTNTDSRMKGQGDEREREEEDNNRRTLLSSIVPRSLNIGYLDSVWSMCKVNLSPPVLGPGRLGQRENNSHNTHNGGGSCTEFLNDRCKISWCVNGTGIKNEEGGNLSHNVGENGRTGTKEEDVEEEDSLILVWKNSGIWEKYVILEKSSDDSHTVHDRKYYSVSESLRGDYFNSGDLNGNGSQGSQGFMGQNEAEDRGGKVEMETRIKKKKKKKKEWEIIRESWREL